MARLLVEDTVVAGGAVSLGVDKDTITIGRSNDADVRLSDLTVSRRHVTLVHGDRGWTLVDRGSVHGTFVDGLRMVAPVVIRPNTAIRIGRYRITFEPERHYAVSETEPAARVRTCDRLIGKSGLLDVSRQVGRIAASDATVLLTGESGTGKELVAQLIHELSPRSGGPYVVVNCPAIAPGMAEYELFGIEPRSATGVAGRAGHLVAAMGGTLVFDEIGDMTLDIQSKILRFLQDHKVDRVGGRGTTDVDVRVIAATHCDLDRAVREGTFRHDLLQRLRALTVHLPPLRDRREDLDELIEHFLRAAAPRRRLSTDARQYLEEYAFPGNVRELEHMIARGHLLAAGPEIETEDLVAHGWGSDFDDTLPPLETAKAMEAAGGTDRHKDATQELYDAIVHQHRSFWEVVHQPFRLGTLSTETVRGLIERGYVESRHSYRRMARLFHIDDKRDYRRLVDFLRRSGLSRSSRRAHS